MYWGFHLVVKEANFDRLDLSADNSYFDGTGNRRLATCRTPASISYFPLLFAQFTSGDGPTFAPGQTVGLLATGDGTESDVTNDGKAHVVKDASSDATTDVGYAPRNTVNPSEAGYSKEDYRIKVLLWRPRSS